MNTNSYIQGGKTGLFCHYFCCFVSADEGFVAKMKKNMNNSSCLLHENKSDVNISKDMDLVLKIKAFKNFALFFHCKAMLF